MGWLSDLLTGIPALPVARERIALAESKVEAIEAENAKLRVENAHLHERLAAAERLILKPDFVEARGVLFKRKADGSFEPDGYCPDCKRALSRN